VSNQAEGGTALWAYQGRDSGGTRGRASIDDEEEVPLSVQNHNHYLSQQNIVRVGQARPWSRDLYARLLTASWWQLVLLCALVYAALNASFAVVFVALGDCIAGARPGSILDAFFGRAGWETIAARTSGTTPTLSIESWRSTKSCRNMSAFVSCPSRMASAASR
jgi:hypothetical protein